MWLTFLEEKKKRIKAENLDNLVKIGFDSNNLNQKFSSYNTIHTRLFQRVHDTYTIFFIKTHKYTKYIVHVNTLFGTISRLKMGRIVVFFKMEGSAAWNELSLFKLGLLYLGTNRGPTFGSLNKVG